MAIKRAVREKSEPVNIGDRAIDNLQFIRETMERSTHFTAVPGFGGILMGVTAIGAAIVANSQAAVTGWITTWLAEAFLAFAIGLLAMWQKARLVETSLSSVPAKKFAFSFAPPLICGVVITFGLWKYGAFEAMIPTWLLCYGAAVVCGGAFSVRAVPIMGWCFMGLGAIAFALPSGYANWMMAASFGLFHIVFGAVIARKYGG